MMDQNHQNGFTLIELSIVLAIIGLIVGGVLVGQDLIKAGELRKFITQIQQYDMAFITFQEKYGCIPGDCINESRFFPTLQNGDNNGLIDSCWPIAQPRPPCVYLGGYDFTKELANAWAALSLAGLIAGRYDPTSTQPGIGFPLVAAQSDNGIMVAAWGMTHYYRTGMGGVWGAGVMPITGSLPSYAGLYSFTPNEALSIDTKIEDGMPVSGTGRVQWVGYCAYNCFEFDTPTQVDSLHGFVADGPLGATSNYCFNSASNQFNTANTTKLCNAAMPAQF